MSEIIKSITIRRVFAGLLTTAALGLGTTGGLNVAQAAPGEWDVGAYDACESYTMDRWEEGTITNGEKHDGLLYCCYMSGGVPAPNDVYGCQAPAVTAATPIAPPVGNVDPDLGADPAPPPDPPKPTKKPPSAPTAPVGDNDGGTGSGDEGGGGAPVG
jgi:hypothetical protein